MILFRWDLTPHQVRLLQGLRDWDDNDGEHTKDAIMCPGINNFVGGVKMLLRERLVYCTEVPVDHAERIRYTGKTRPKWGITEKGRLMLKLVEIEIEDQANNVKGLTHGSEVAAARQRLRGSVRT